MSITTIFEYNNSLDYTFNASEVEFTGSLAQLRKVPATESYVQDFTTDT